MLFKILFLYIVYLIVVEVFRSCKKNKETFAHKDSQYASPTDDNKILSGDLKASTIDNLLPANKEVVVAAFDVTDEVDFGEDDDADITPVTPAYETSNTVNEEVINCDEIESSVCNPKWSIESISSCSLNRDSCVTKTLEKLPIVDIPDIVYAETVTPIPQVELTTPTPLPVLR